VRSVGDKAVFAVQSVFVFTVFAGLTVLLAAVQSSRDERRFESAMLRTLGASRKVVLQGVLAEFTVLGLLSGACLRRWAHRLRGICRERGCSRVPYGLFVVVALGLIGGGRAGGL